MLVKLNSAFKEYVYADKSHSYYHRIKKLTSVTQLISKLQTPFDKKYWSVFKAYEFSGLNPKYNWHLHQERKVGLEDGTIVHIDSKHDIKVPPEKVAAQWQLDSLVGKERGSYIHNYLEAKENRLIDIPKKPELDLDTVSATHFSNSIQTAISLSEQFLKDTYDYLIPVAMEYTVGSIDLGLAGRFDRLYWNMRSLEYEIWDFKTDKKIGYKGRDKIKIFDIPDCEFEKYSLQTSLYKYMIEEAIQEKIGTSHIVHFDIKNNSYDIIAAKDYTNLIKEKKDEISWATFS